MRLLSSLTLGAVVAAWVVTTAATAPQSELVSGTPHAAVSYDLAHEDTGDTACWIVFGTDALDGGSENELICGPRGQRPDHSVALGEEVTSHGTTWVATVSGFEPVSAN